MKVIKIKLERARTQLFKLLYNLTVPNDRTIIDNSTYMGAANGTDAASTTEKDQSLTGT